MLPHLPPQPPFLSHAAGEERSRSDPAAVNDTEFTTEITPLPRCGSYIGNLLKGRC